jgi:hypothetical protein
MRFTSLMVRGLPRSYGFLRGRADLVEVFDWSGPEVASPLAYFRKKHLAEAILDVFESRGHLVNEYSDFTCSFTSITSLGLRDEAIW